MSVCVIVNEVGQLVVSELADSCTYKLAQQANVTFTSTEVMHIALTCAGLYATVFVYRLSIDFLLNRF